MAESDRSQLVEQLESLLPRYATPVPRYTSYPTAPVWNESYDRESFRRDLAAVGADLDRALSLYVHVPFCRSLCHFCACNRVITRREELPARYLDVIEREIEAVAEALGRTCPATQLHWGGGTPTHLRPDQLRRLFGSLTRAFPPREGAEISIEADPRVTTDAHIEALRQCGFNRVCLGVQDFDPRVQEAIHRIQPPAQIAAVVESARRAGFSSVGFDLIYGLPFQTEASFARTLDAVLALEPDRLALYSYAHVPWVARQQRGFERDDLPAPEAKLRIFVLALRCLLAAGYVHVGMDHFAKPGDALARALRERTLRRNFMGYTTQSGVHLVGFGPSAISELAGSYAQSHRELRSWEAGVLEHGLATLRGHALSRDDRSRRWIIARIMCHGEVCADEYREVFAEDFEVRYASERAELERLAEDGLVLAAAGGGFRLSALGRLLVRNVAAVFDAYLSAQRRERGPLFSKAV